MKKLERTEILADLARSGLSTAEYARQRSLSVESLYRWQTVAWLPAEGFSRVQNGVVVDVCISGIQIRVPIESLRAVIKELSHEA